MQPHFYDNAGAALVPDLVAPFTNLGGITFTALEPADTNHRMRVTISNPLTTNNPDGSTTNTVDITVAYGARSETYRKGQPDRHDQP